jgi:hypothetical protein
VKNERSRHLMLRNALVPRTPATSAAPGEVTSAKRVLLAIFESDRPLEGLHTALESVEPFGSEVHVLCVLPAFDGVNPLAPSVRDLLRAVEHRIEVEHSTRVWLEAGTGSEIAPQFLKEQRRSNPAGGARTRRESDHRRFARAEMARSLDDPQRGRAGGHRRALLGVGAAVGATAMIVISRWRHPHDRDHRPCWPGDFAKAGHRASVSSRAGACAHDCATLGAGRVARMAGSGISAVAATLGRGVLFPVIGSFSEWGPSISARAAV